MERAAADKRGEGRGVLAAFLAGRLRDWSDVTHRQILNT
jgi:hypothetical protein